MSNAQLLPPKMLAQYAQMALDGLADNYVGGNIFEFYRGNQVICIIGPDCPVGLVSKVSASEMQRMKSIARPFVKQAAS